MPDAEEFRRQFSKRFGGGTKVNAASAAATRTWSSITSFPVVRGGANTTRNVQILCEACNRSKGASEPGGH